MHKTPQVQSVFGSWVVEKLHAVVARSAFCFWKFGCSKSARDVGHLKKICKAALRLACAVQETSLSKMFGCQGADFLREVAFWSIRSSALLRWFCVTSASLLMTWPHLVVAAQYFTHMQWKNCKTHWYEVVSSALNFPLLKEVSQNWFNFLTLSTSNIEEVSQNCSVVDAVWEVS